MQFKTMKYMPDYPERFASIGEARAWMHAFTSWYNHEHRHSGIGLHPRQRPLRHRRRNPARSSADPGRGLRRPPRAVPPTPAGTHTARTRHHQRPRHTRGKNSSNKIGWTRLI
ncbi:integrase core domain-containing protein [Rhodococcus sp. OK270]|uniref:integrase core domain-containing protein n=1 Tax=unclassified Rhodococcus (in: high G+C Gram-positive bacteria) TaxID=192944 RepID=UPI00359C47E9